MNYLFSLFYYICCTFNISVWNVFLQIYYVFLFKEMQFYEIIMISLMCVYLYMCVCMCVKQMLHGYAYRFDIKMSKIYVTLYIAATI